MSSQASKADLHRIVSREKELELNYSQAPATPPSDTSLEHIGAHFEPRKGSCLNYPPYVEVTEDEAVEQSEAVYHYSLQHSPENDRLQDFSLTPTHTPIRKDRCMSSRQYNDFNLRRLAQHRISSMSARSVGTQQSSSTPTRATSPSTTNTQGGHADRSFFEHEYVSEYSVNGHTPSDRSLSSDNVETDQDGTGPFKPAPYSAYDLYNTTHNMNDYWAPAKAWNDRADSDSIRHTCHLGRRT